MADDAYVEQHIQSVSTLGAHFMPGMTATVTIVTSSAPRPALAPSRTHCGGAGARLGYGKQCHERTCQNTASGGCDGLRPGSTGPREFTAGVGTSITSVSSTMILPI